MVVAYNSIHNIRGIKDRNEQSIWNWKLITNGDFLSFFSVWRSKITSSLEPTPCLEHMIETLDDVITTFENEQPAMKVNIGWTFSQPLRADFRCNGASECAYQ